MTDDNSRSEDDSEDLHGSAPDKSATALLLIDVINDLDFEEADQLLPHAEAMANKIAALVSRVRKADIPIIYVNDNFGRWRSDFKTVIEHCVSKSSLGKHIVEKLRPESADYFVLKPKHSAFYSTTLDVLLRHLQVNRLILTGMAGNICVLFTANDAYMRGYELIVPKDCIASNTIGLNRYATDQMEHLLKADVRSSDQITDDELRKLRHQ
jgi:nicotinamidase-related amidase